MTNFTMLYRSRPRLLAQALTSLEGTENCDFTFLGDEPDQTCSSLVRFFMKSRPGAHCIRGVSRGTASARNLVIAIASQARGKYLYLSDDDVYFHPAWLYTMTYIYPQAEKLGFKVIGAYNHPYHHPINSFPVDFWHAQPIGPNGERLPDIQLAVHEVQALALQSMLMRWEAWDEFGPFRETPAGSVCQGEDVDFGNKIREAGYKLGVISPALLANCGITNSFGQPIPGAEMVRSQVPEGIIAE
jgi:GT2 family glycosyltransferase